MKRTHLLLPLALILFVVSHAIAAPGPSKEEKNLAKEIARIDRTASSASGLQAVVGRISVDFKVSEADIRNLRTQNFGYGEIVTIYSLARQMPGGITDANVRTICALRQGPPTTGWGQIARQLNVKLGPSVSQSKKLNDESHRDMKRGQASGGSGAKPAGQGGSGKAGGPASHSSAR